MGINIARAANLTLVNFTGCVTEEEFAMSLSEITEQDLLSEKVPDKLVLLDTDEIELNFENLFPKAKFRQEVEYPSKSKTAISAPTDFTYGLARMWQSIMNSPSIEVGVFKSEEEAREWLKLQS